MEIIMGIDASTKSSGVGIFNTTTKELLYSKCIKTASTDTLKRIHIMVDAIENAIQEFGVTKIVIEDVRPDYNMRTMRPLMYLQCQIAFLIHDKYPKIEIEYIVPSSWRSGVGIHTGRGIKRDQLKQLSIDKVKELFNLDVNDDEAEGILIAYSQVNKKPDLH